MKEIESAVMLRDKQIKSSAVKIKKALKDTVDLDNLGVKMMLKYSNFLQQKVNSHIEAFSQSKAGRSHKQSTLKEDTLDINITFNLTDDNEYSSLSYQ